MMISANTVEPGLMRDAGMKFIGDNLAEVELISSRTSAYAAVGNESSRVSVKCRSGVGET